MERTRERIEQHLSTAAAEWARLPIAQALARRYGMEAEALGREVAEHVRQQTMAELAEAYSSSNYPGVRPERLAAARDGISLKASEIGVRVARSRKRQFLDYLHMHFYAQDDFKKEYETAALRSLKDMGLQDAHVVRALDEGVEPELLHLVVDRLVEAGARVNRDFEAILERAHAYHELPSELAIRAYTETDASVRRQCESKLDEITSAINARNPQSHTLSQEFLFWRDLPEAVKKHNAFDSVKGLVATALSRPSLRKSYNPRTVTLVHGHTGLTNLDEIHRALDKMYGMGARVEPLAHYSRPVSVEDFLAAHRAASPSLSHEAIAQEYSRIGSMAAALRSLQAVNAPASPVPSSNAPRPLLEALRSRFPSEGSRSVKYSSRQMRLLARRLGWGDEELVAAAKEGEGRNSAELLAWMRGNLSPSGKDLRKPSSVKRPVEPVEENGPEEREGGEEAAPGQPQLVRIHQVEKDWKPNDFKSVLIQLGFSVKHGGGGHPNNFVRQREGYDDQSLSLSSSPKRQAFARALAKKGVTEEEFEEAKRRAFGNK